MRDTWLSDGDVKGQQIYLNLLMFEFSNEYIEFFSHMMGQAQAQINHKKVKVINEHPT